MAKRSRTSPSMAAHSASPSLLGPAARAASKAFSASATRCSAASKSWLAASPRALVNLAACREWLWRSVSKRRNLTSQTAAKVVPASRPVCRIVSSFFSAPSSAWPSTTVCTGVLLSPTSSCSTSTVASAGKPGMSLSAMARINVDLPAPLAPMKPYLPGNSCSLVSTINGRSPTEMHKPLISIPNAAQPSSRSAAKRLCWVVTSILACCLEGGANTSLASFCFAFFCFLVSVLASFSSAFASPKSEATTGAWSTSGVPVLVGDAGFSGTSLARIFLAHLSPPSSGSVSPGSNSSTSSGVAPSSMADTT
mmetsp:Transcript_83794/g.191257  ORF Transcript_83794/g.191257 Transcript_83794/m.191257 type:complete len:309 (-) Transcript_83794:146-1072(-)